VDSTDFLAYVRHTCLEEIKQAWIFIVVGLAACLAGSWLWRSQSAFRHAVWPLCLVALIQLAVGGTILVRAPERLRSLELSYGADAQAFKAAETLRLTRVLDLFRFYKLAEIAGVLCAMGLALFFAHNAVARGWALGLLLQSVLLLAADLVAEQRSEAYLDLLRRI
jgi:hypothetical protein